MNVLRPALIIACLACLSLTACQKKCKPGEDPACWIEALNNPELTEKAVGELKALEDKSAVPALIKTFEAASNEPKIREEIAEIFGKWLVAEAVKPMMEAIDLSVGPDKDGKKAKATNRANQKIATALGVLGDKQAVGHLLRLMKATKNKNVKRAAIRALGHLQAAEAVEDLMAIVEDKDVHKILRANALFALGDIGDPKLVDKLVIALYMEKAFFFAQANLALVKIGAPAVGPLIDVLEGKNKEVKRILENNVEVLAGAMEANAAQVLGDIGDPKAIEPLLAAVEKVSKWEADNKLIVMVRLINALGDIGDAKAVKPILKYLETEFWDVSTVVANALTNIGDRSVVPELLKHAQDVKKHPRVRVPLVDAIGNLGTDEVLPAMKEMQEKFKDVTLAPTIAKSIKRLEAYAECKQKVDCWIGKLKSKEAPVREKAAYELGQIGDPKAIDPLIGIIDDPDEYVRWGVIFAFSKLNSKKPIPAIEELVNDKEKGSARFKVVNDKYKRLIARLQRTGK